MVKCKHCGRTIPYDANLCPYCGRSIKQFQQKDILDTDAHNEEDDVKRETEIKYPSTKSKNDRKLLFFILAVLVLLLVAGLIYRSSLSDDEDDVVAKDSLKIENKATSTGNQAKPTYNPQKKQFVVVNGEGVRFRFGPSTKHQYLKDDKGNQISVNKGTRLQCVGEQDNWYQVIYNGKKYYMSKDYTYLVE